MTGVLLKFFYAKSEKYFGGPAVKLGDRIRT